MNEVRNTIGLLCEHLNCLLQVDMKPEYFRLAKFNKCDENIVPIFWNLLQKLTKSSNSNLVDGVKLSLFSMNYRCMTFYSLPNDMSCGSRELLIAFGFVIAKTNILYELIQRRIENTPFNPKYSILTKTRVNPITFDENNLQNDKDKKNAKRWIEGRINLTKKLIVETEDKINKLSKQVKESIKIPDVEQISINDILALKKNEYGKIFLSETDSVMKFLENHEKWIKKERVFWKWMNSVVSEKKKYPEEINTEILKEFMSLEQTTSKNCFNC